MYTSIRVVDFRGVNLARERDSNGSEIDGETFRKSILNVPKSINQFRKYF